MSESFRQTPSAWKAGNLSYSTGLSLKTARKMLEAGEKEAEKQGVPMAIAIVDAGGNLLAFNRMDHALLVSIHVAIDKAFTAVYGKLHTRDWTQAFQSGGFAPLFLHDRWITLPGGFPIISNKLLLGGIGVSGGIIEDLYVARAALETGGFTVDGVNAALGEAEGTKGKE